MLAVCITGLLMGLSVSPTSSYPAADILPSHQLTNPTGYQPSKLSEAQLAEQARLITVKVISGETWGSGILIQRQGSLYAVLTNNHVLQPGKPIEIVTSDGVVHQAALNKTANFRNKDLALLQFSSDRESYAVAVVGTSTQLMVGEDVFAAGFPFVDDPKQGAFFFTIGKVAFVSDKALEDGYQIGYTNAIAIGMSGGPVLNHQGELIAINGMHAKPLWGDPYVYENGQQPCLPLRQKMRELSWAIPVDVFVQLAPNDILSSSRDLHLPIDFEPISQDSDHTESNAKDIFEEASLYGLVLQQEAELLKKCIPVK
jgi:S1-C subfamily serine protease